MYSVFDIFNVAYYDDGVNTSFLLNNNNQFLLTDYKVMKGQINGSLINCEKLLFNGKTKLLYFTENYTALSSLLSRMDEKNIFTVLADILKVFLDIKENGFLDYHRLLLAPEYVFVDMNTMKVHMLYLPVERSITPLYSHGHEIRHMLIQTLSAAVRLNSFLVQRLTMMISEETMTLEEIYNELMNQWKEADETVVISQKKIEVVEEKALNLISINPEFPARFRISKRDFSIGREKGRVDGVIVGSPVVGRVHCHIRYKNDKYFIEDNASRNGTFLNDDRLVQGNPKEILERSFIRVANVTFKVIYE